MGIALRTEPILSTPALIALPLLLALEPQAGSTASHATLDRDAAAALAALVADDLHACLPQVRQTRLALAGALFDPVELLRPGFPVWATLEELARRVPRGQLDNVVAFGHHDGHMPTSILQPAAEFSGGPLQLLPLCLLAPDSLAAELGEQLEAELVARGEASAPTADWLMRQFGLRLEHARYLSRNDLLAMTCVQYEHVNLAPLWNLLEAALLSPARAESVLSARGLAWRWQAGRVTVQSPDAWLAAHRGEPGQRARDFAALIFELRQYAALLQAHQLPLQLADGGDSAPGCLLETLARAEPQLPPPQLLAHEAPGLGVVAVTVAQTQPDGGTRVLGHAYPLTPQAWTTLPAQLAREHGSTAAVRMLGEVVLDAQGRLAAPAARA